MRLFAILALLVSHVAFAESPLIVRSQRLPEGIYLGSHALLFGSNIILVPHKYSSPTNSETFIEMTDVATGKNLWKQPIDDFVDELLQIDNVVVAISRREKLWAIDILSGKVLWSRQTATTDGQLDSLFVGQDGNLYHIESETDLRSQIDPLTGEILAELAHAPYGVVLADGSSLGSTLNIEGHEVPKDYTLFKQLVSGERAWEFRDFRFPSYLMGLLNARNGNSVITEYISASHPSEALRRRFFSFLIDSQGQKQWEIINEEPPVLIQSLDGSEHLLSIGEDRKTLISRDVETSTIRWTTSFENITTLMESKIGGDTIIKSDDKGVTALNLRTGALKWVIEKQGKHHANVLTASQAYTALTTYDEPSGIYTLEIVRN